MNSAATILHAYKGEQPFNLFLKSFFNRYKKFGSRDRKQISQLCYSYFRLGHALQELPTDERILTGLFLCEMHSQEILEELKPEWNELIALSAEEKSEVLNFSTREIFPWLEELSSKVDLIEFCNSFLIQPDLFLRLRPGMEGRVKQKLHEAGIIFNEINHSCLALENSVQVDKLITLDEEAVIQDYNSQRVGEFLKPVQYSTKDSSSQLTVYDCCAASGGKSILAYDVLSPMQLTVSDIRESIISNLKRRFELTGIKKYQAFVQDLTSSNKNPMIKNENIFDLVIADAPCSGSGTWSRTPEQLYYFHKEKIDYYSNLQKSILENVVPLVRKGGYLLYITCSVFKKENEDVIEYLETDLNLKVQKVELLKGYDKKADTLFAALLQRE